MCHNLGMIQTYATYRIVTNNLFYEYFVVNLNSIYYTP